MAHEDYLAVIAIDFGTTFSGYAFSMRGDPESIKMNKSWGAEVGFQSYKTPTSVLTNPDGSFHSFGYEAENNFVDLDGEEMAEGYQLFQRFKMELYSHEKLTHDVKIKSTRGEERPAMDIITMVLQFMKTHALEAISKTLLSGISEDYIRWVITVPAIWRDDAKKFMRLCAIQAGLVKDVLSPDLIIALEPEAAGLYCRALPVDSFRGLTSATGSVTLKPGDSYVIVDCGGGTIDITVHELTEDGTVKEVNGACGGPWGGIHVDRKYYQLLGEIFGNDFINKLKQDHPSTWFAMMVDFEMKKRAAKPENTTGINLILSLPFSKQFEKHTGEDVEDRIRKMKHLGIKFSNGMLRINGETVRGMYSEILPLIKQQLGSLLSDCNDDDVSAMFVVGGFGESAYLREFLFSEFSEEVRMLIPDEAGMCVMKGSVMFGHNTGVIASRIARYNYCLSAYRYFDPEIDDPGRMEIVGGRRRIHALTTIIPRGKQIMNGYVYFITGQSTGLIEPTLQLDLCCTEDDITDDPKHPSVQKLGTLIVPSPNVENQSRKVKYEIRFGSTDILFSAVDLDSGNKVKSSFDI